MRASDVLGEVERTPNVGEVLHRHFPGPGFWRFHAAILPLAGRAVKNGAELDLVESAANRANVCRLAETDLIVS